MLEYSLKRPHFLSWWLRFLRRKWGLLSGPPYPRPAFLCLTPSACNGPRRRMANIITTGRTRVRQVFIKAAVGKGCSAIWGRICSSQLLWTRGVFSSLIIRVGWESLTWLYTAILRIGPPEVFIVMLTHKQNLERDQSVQSRRVTSWQGKESRLEANMKSKWTKCLQMSFF